MEIIMITDYKGYLRQHLDKSSMDKEMIKELFNEEGYICKEYTFEEIVNENISLKDKLIIS
ncbi:MAG: hypothetical protein JJU16_03315 [Alkalibacterium sp.]|nr:hypothetical protein [Alkalibacterium sp.]